MTNSTYHEYKEKRQALAFKKIKTFVEEIISAEKHLTPLLIGSVIRLLRPKQ